MITADFTKCGIFANGVFDLDYVSKVFKFFSSSSGQYLCVFCMRVIINVSNSFLSYYT